MRASFAVVAAGCFGVLSCSDDSSPGPVSSSGGASSGGSAQGGAGATSGGTATLTGGTAGSGGRAQSSGGTGNSSNGGASSGGASSGGASSGGASSGGASNGGASNGGASNGGASSGGIGGGPTASACAPAIDTGSWAGRKICLGAEVDALVPRIGLPKAYNHGVMSHPLTEPMVAGSPYAYSISLTSMDNVPIAVEIWGSTASCAGEPELLAEQVLGVQTGFRGTVCATLQPTKAFAHVLLVVRSEGGYAHNVHTMCPAGTCQGTDGVAGPWPGKSQPFCDAGEPERCEACTDVSTCDAPAYTDKGDGTVSSSCCGLTWQKMAAPRPMNRAAAMTYCNELELAGRGWRVPTLAELLTLLDDRFTPRIDPVAFPETVGGAYLSSSMDHVWEDKVNVVAFNSGNVSNMDPELTSRVRCVR